VADRGFVIALGALALVACGERRDATAVSDVSALADEVPMPQMRVGDVFEYESRSRNPISVGDASSRWTMTVRRVEPNGRFHAEVKGFDPIARADFTNAAEYAGPWNSVLPAPYVAPEFLRFPLRQGAAWTSVAPNPVIQQTRTVRMEVKGRQSLDIAGATVDCVRIEGSDTMASPGPPASTITAPTRLWYCPALRAVGRVEADIPTVPVTQTLVAHRLQP
jgi:hypothetical protein